MGGNGRAGSSFLQTARQARDGFLFISSQIFCHTTRELRATKRTCFISCTVATGFVFFTCSKGEPKLQPIDTHQRVEGTTPLMSPHPGAEHTLPDCSTIS